MGGKMPSRTFKKTPGKPCIGTDNKRKKNSGTSSSKTKKARIVPRFYETKIRISADEHAWGLPYFGEQKYFSKFVLEAYREKVKRAEAHDKEAKRQTLISNINLLEPILKEMHVQGKLKFLENGRGE
jgi:hypothetical protein